MSLSLFTVDAPLCPPPVSSLVLADRLITLAQDAERAGYQAAASRLVVLAHAVFDEAPVPGFRTHN